MRAIKQSQFSPEFQIFCGLLRRTKRFYFIFMLGAAGAHTHINSETQHKKECVYALNEPQRGFFSHPLMYSDLCDDKMMLGFWFFDLNANV